ncbi:MAG TPA: hypothetical protein VLT16_08200 [Candidatus Limnocylindrales bacterium]|nr:hypothetical protein [Candidatus Limnocylindrales bacterium]
MKVYKNQTIENQTIVLEECFFESCMIRNCEIFYSGGHFEWSNTAFDNCRFHFQGAANMTVKLCQHLGMMKQQQTPPQSVGKSSSGAN